jgi:hypothetical protein
MEGRSIIGVVIIGLLFVGFIGGGLIYMNTAASYDKALEEKDALLAEKESQIEALQSKVSESQTTKIICSDCHGEVTDFHTVEKITRLDALRGKNPRICTTCHGLDPHEIHGNLLSRNKLECDNCHLKDGKLTIPQVLPGQTLVCEQCHLEGNYVDIHVNYGGGTCSSCHVGDIGNIHKNTIANVERLLGEATVEAEVPLTGKEILEQKCVGCHDLATTTDLRKTPEGWKQTLEDMKDFAQLTDDEWLTLEEYLNQEYGA